MAARWSMVLPRLPPHSHPISSSSFSSQTVLKSSYYLFVGFVLIVVVGINFVSSLDDMYVLRLFLFR